MSSILKIIPKSLHDVCHHLNTLYSFNAPPRFFQIPKNPLFTLLITLQCHDLKSQKRVKDASTTTGLSSCWVTTREKTMKREISAVDRENIADEAVPINKPLHEDQINDLQIPRAASCTIFTCTPDSACSEFPGNIQ